MACREQLESNYPPQQGHCVHMCVEFWTSSYFSLMKVLPALSSLNSRKVIKRLSDKLHRPYLTVHSLHLIELASDIYSTLTRVILYIAKLRYMSQNGIYTETEGSMAFRDPKALSCSDLRTARVLLRTRGPLTTIDPIVRGVYNLFRLTCLSYSLPLKSPYQICRNSSATNDRALTLMNLYRPKDQVALKLWRRLNYSKYGSSLLRTLAKA